MTVVEAFALQQFIVGSGSALFAVLLAHLITAPITRRINAASDRFWARFDARRAARQR